MSISSLREELNKSKQKEELLVEEAAMSWLKDNVIPLNEGVDPRVLKHLIELVQKFDDKFNVYGDKLPTIALIIGNAENELNNVVSGNAKYRSKKRTAELLQNLTSVYNHISDMFKNKLKIVLSAPLFKKAREEGNKTIPLKAVDGIDYDMCCNAFRQCMKPTTIQQRLWGNIINKNGYESIVRELMGLSHSDLVDLINGVPKVPLAVAVPPVDASIKAEPINTTDMPMSQIVETENEKEKQSTVSSGDTQVMNEAIQNQIIEAILEGYEQSDLQTLHQELDVVMEAGVGPEEIGNFAGFVQLNKLMKQRAILAEQGIPLGGDAVLAGDNVILNPWAQAAQQAAQHVARRTRPGGLAHRVSQKIATWMKGGGATKGAAATKAGMATKAGAATKAASATATTAAGGAGSGAAGAAAGLGGLAAGLVGAAGAGITAYAGKEYYKYKTREDVKTLVPAMNAIGNALKGLPAGAGIQKLKNDAVRMSDPSKKFGDFKLKDTNERHIAMITVADMFTALKQAKDQIEQNYLSEIISRLESKTGKVLSESKIRTLVKESKRVPHKTFFEAVIMKEAIETDDDIDAVMTTIRGALTNAVNQHSSMKNALAAKAKISVKPLDALKKYGLTPDEIADSIAEKLKGMNADGREKFIRNFFTQADKAGEISSQAVTKVAADAAKGPQGGTSTTGGDKGTATGKDTATGAPGIPTGGTQATPTSGATGTMPGGDVKATQQAPQAPMSPKAAQHRALNASKELESKIEQKLQQFIFAQQKRAQGRAAPVTTEANQPAQSNAGIATRGNERSSAPGNRTMQGYSNIASPTVRNTAVAGQVPQSTGIKGINAPKENAWNLDDKFANGIQPLLMKWYQIHPEDINGRGAIFKQIKNLIDASAKGNKIATFMSDQELEGLLDTLQETTRKPAIIGSKRWIQERKLIYLNYELALLEEGYIAI